MSKFIDGLLKERLTGTEYSVPQSFEKKLNDTIHEIENCEVRKGSKRFWRLSANKVAGLALFVLMLSVISISSYAAVNLFQDRMSAMPEKETEDYNKDVQKSSLDADAYSRKLTDIEEERMIKLRKQYEKEGKFPQKEIKQLKKNEAAVKEGLYFVAEESKFYLPDRTLSEEELLEIIDLQEKRDYSVQQQNAAGDKTDKEIKKNGKLEKQSIEIVKKLYNLHEKELKIVSTELVDGCYIYVIKGDDISLSVYYSKEDVAERVSLKKNNSSAHQSDIKLKSVKTKLISEKLKERVEIFSGKKIDSGSLYCLVDNKENLAYGTVSYYCQMSDGSGCVAVYSMAYHDLYDMYMIDHAAMVQEIKEKTKKAKAGGYHYKLLE